MRAFLLPLGEKVAQAPDEGGNEGGSIPDERAFRNTSDQRRPDTR